MAQGCSTDRLGSILVLGSGKTGLAVASRCLNLVGGVATAVTLYDERPRESLSDEVSELERRGLVVLAGGPLLECVSKGARYDLCIASPGISVFSDLYHAAEAISTEVISEPEFAYRLSPTNWVAISGTNGKTTTTALVTHLLKSSGFMARSVGNIGTPTIEGVCERREQDLDVEQILVAELSSYQLAETRCFHPRVAVLLNITPDHIDWHKTHEHYRDSKVKMFENMGPDDFAVLGVDDPEVSRIAEQIESREDGPTVMRVTLESGDMMFGATVSEEHEYRLTVMFEGERHLLCSSADLAIKGEHNIVNALCAACVAIAYGADDDTVSEGLLTFNAIEHRLQFVATVDGVSYYNDSKATNPDAVLKALTAFEDTPLTLLLGGYDKGTDLTELVDAVAARCKHIVLFGAAADRFAEAFDTAGVSYHQTQTMREALLCAKGLAQTGEAIVLSPACASFDEFTSFEHRGEVFIDIVSTLSGDRG